MMEINKLSGALLDFWVARSEGDTAEILTDEKGDFCVREHRLESGSVTRGPFEPSSNWMDGGYFIDRDGIAMQRNDSGTWNAGLPATKASGYEYWAHCQYSAPNALTAAMRTKVASVYGETVPDEVK